MFRTKYRMWIGPKRHVWIYPNPLELIGHQPKMVAHYGEGDGHAEMSRVIHERRGDESPVSAPTTVDHPHDPERLEERTHVLPGGHGPRSSQLMRLYEGVDPTVVTAWFVEIAH